MKLERNLQSAMKSRSWVERSDEGCGDADGFVSGGEATASRSLVPRKKFRRAASNASEMFASMFFRIFFLRNAAPWIDVPRAVTSCDFPEARSLTTTFRSTLPKYS